MAITIIELFNSRLGTAGKDIRYTRRWRLSGGDAAEAIAALAGDSGAASYNGIAKSSTTLTGQITDTEWYAETEYQTPTPQTTNDPDELPTPIPAVQLSTSGGQVNIRNNISTVATAGTVPTDTGGAINFDGENVNGVEVFIPGMEFTCTRYFAAGDFTPFAILAYSGTVNNATFQGLAVGSVLFIGCDARRRMVAGVEGMWEVTYKFQYSPIQTSITIGGIGPVNKDGFDYLEVLYDNDTDSTTNKRVKVPVGIIVHRVYPRTNLNDLGV